MGQKGAVWPPKECMEMKKLILVTLVLCMALSACTEGGSGESADCGERGGFFRGKHRERREECGE